MLLLLMTIDKEECQTVHTHKEDNCRKISHTLTIIIQVCNSQLKIEHLANTNESSNFWHFRTMWANDQPLLEKFFNGGWADRNSQNSLKQVSKGHKYHLGTNVCKLRVTVKWHRINGVSARGEPLRISGWNLPRKNYRDGATVCSQGAR